jgi:hypothetical protein
MAFSVSGESTPDVPIWQADLPADPAAAAEVIAGIRQGLEQTQEALAAAEPRIEALVQQQGRPISFSTTTADESLALPEQELLGLLQEAQFGSQRISFSTEADSQGSWEDTVEKFQQFTAQVQKTLTHYAWVETRVAGRLLARTSVNWLGDMETNWQDQLDTAQMAIHRSTLQNALSGRILMLRTLIVITASAGKLSVLLTTPGGALLALPAAWKFISQIRAELERHQQIMEVNQNGK